MSVTEDVRHFFDEFSKYIFGRERELKVLLASFLARGNSLLEDSPGMGKTSTVQVFTKLLGLELSRIQFTSDLLPADIIGGNLFDKDTGKLSFIKGPIFSNVILADELNRAGPKTQSALLQAMSERELTFDGKTYDLPEFFTVIATQNPSQQYGTFPLPESQLDRFMISLSFESPSRSLEKEIIKNSLGNLDIKRLNSFFSIDQLKLFSSKVDSVTYTDNIVEYILDLLAESRKNSFFQTRLSPRAGKDLLSVSKGYAWLSNRDYIVPDDIFDVVPFVFGHRVGAESVQKGAYFVRKLSEKVSVF